MISKTTKHRFAYKVDKLVWTLLAVLPVFIYLVINYRNPSASDFFAYVNTYNPLPLVKNALDSVTLTAFGQAFSLNSLFAYMISVELLHVLFDVVVFVPRLAHKWIGRALQDD